MRHPIAKDLCTQDASGLISRIAPPDPFPPAVKVTFRLQAKTPLTTPMSRVPKAGRHDCIHQKKDLLLRGIVSRGSGSSRSKSLLDRLQKRIWAFASAKRSVSCDPMDAHRCHVEVGDRISRTIRSSVVGMSTAEAASNLSPKAPRKATVREI